MNGRDETSNECCHYPVREAAVPVMTRNRLCKSQKKIEMLFGDRPGLRLGLLWLWRGLQLAKGVTIREIRVDTGWS
jgi:hypothetical protein